MTSGNSGEHEPLALSGEVRGLISGKTKIVSGASNGGGLVEAGSGEISADDR